jgi:soluble lytic murein transglycosylase-like protein
MQTIRRKFGERLRRLTLVAVVAAAGLLIGPRAYAQAPDDDPAARAMRRIQAAVDERAASAERALAASKLVNQSAESRKQGKSEEARKSLQQAEMMVASSVPAARSGLTEALLRRIAEEQTALSPPAPVATSKPDWAGLKQGGHIPRLVLARYNSHRDSLTRILSEERLPVAVLSVALIESRFNPQALSPKGALGIWQLMPATARRYGLTVAPGNDHRLHPEHATRAAARYLRDLYQMFGDWKLALAAYNAGEGRVQRAIDRAGVRDFDELARRRLLPLETRNYVPAVLAAWAQMNAAEARVPVEE